MLLPHMRDELIHRADSCAANDAALGLVIILGFF
jgi:hypothetical protein